MISANHDKVEIIANREIVIPLIDSLFLESIFLILSSLRVNIKFNVLLDRVIKLLIAQKYL